MDECAPENVLEVTARAITYYLDVSAECTRRIVAVEGAIKALCNRLVVVDLSSRTSKDLGEQCVKVNTRDPNSLLHSSQEKVISGTNRNLPLLHAPLSNNTSKSKIQ